MHAHWEQGERLAGNVGGAWRVGDTIRRATGPWTPAVHSLLDYLAPRLAHIPQALGFDDHAREILSYLPGRVVDIDSAQILASWYMFLFQLPIVPEWTLVGRAGRGWSRLAGLLVRYGQAEAAAERDGRAMAAPGAFASAVNWYRAVPLVNPRSTEVEISVPTLFIWSGGDTAVLRKAAESCRNWVTGPYRFETLRGVSHWIPDQAPAIAATMLFEQLGTYPG